MLFSRRLATAAALLVPLLFGCKKGCGRDGEETDTNTVVDTDPMPDPRTTTIQIVAVDPAVGLPGTPFNVTVMGSGFQSGARVSFDPTPATSVKFIDENTLQVGVPGLPERLYDVTVTNPDGKKSTMRNGLQITAGFTDCRFAVVQFGFDIATLDAAGKSVLDRNMACYQGSTDKVRIYGHTDERGTTEYNLALGERRASVVVNYLKGSGIAGSRVIYGTFGEEKPVDGGHDESAWAKNRRVEVLLGF